jgi:hypothetical protein
MPAAGLMSPDLSAAPVIGLKLLLKASLVPVSIQMPAEPSSCHM